MRVIILAAGEGSRWGNHLGYTKHLLPIGGEPLLHRTVRLLRQLHPGLDVRVCAPPESQEQYSVPGASTFPADLNPARFDADKFLSSRAHWCGEADTILLFGDCWFTREALATILAAEVHDWQLFARFKPSQITGAPWAECWAYRLAPHFLDAFAEVGERLVADYMARRIHRIGGWEFYARLTGADVHQPGVYAGKGVEIDDWTEDFDFAADFGRWAERRVLEGVSR